MKGSHIIIGAQWGDEGKGKVVDACAENADAVVRYHGGPNAGHTLNVGGEKTVLHILPSGIVRSGMLNLVGPYVVCDPEILVSELEMARRAGSSVMLDARAPLILPIHKEIDIGRERACGAGAIGTTKRGIGPRYEDHAARRGPTLGDLASRERLRESLTAGGYYQERAIVALHHGQYAQSLDDAVAWCTDFAGLIVPHLGDTVRKTHELASANGRLIFEGAQGMMLDLIHGGPPYCTSSLCGSGAVAATMGFYGPTHVMGVTKAYATRVGAGPFPTELNDDVGRILSSKGKEFGATTGRPRRCGWLDLVTLKYACRVGGVTELVITKLDILTDLPQIKLCIDYDTETGGGEGSPAGSINPLDSLTADVLKRARPRYKLHRGWTGDLRSCRSFSDLPVAARDYVDDIETIADLRVIGVSVGPDREEIIWKK